MAEQFPCPNGTYNPEFGKSSVDQCLNCTQGHFCEKGTVQPVPCPIGTYISLYIIFLLSFNPLVTSRTNLYDFDPGSHFELLIAGLVTWAIAKCIVGE